MRIQFLGGTNNGRASIVDTQRTINFYPEITGEQISLIGTAGLRLVVDTSPSADVVLYYYQDIYEDIINRWQDSDDVENTIYQDSYED
jgi:hypothetical protein